LIGAAADLPHLRFMVHGVRYPKRVLRFFDKTGIRYEGWVPNFAVPEVFAKFRMTLHILRSFYCTALPGIPTIRPFEAMACGIPLVTTQWRDTKQLFHEGQDYLMAESPGQMRQYIRLLTGSEQKRQDLAGHALETIRRRHHCDLRAEQLEEICRTLTARVG
jgi:spore maturation protein CgeB